MNVYGVIMCGGSGTRLWPASRPSQPKQFIPLISDETSFQETVLRVSQTANFAGLIIVAGESHESALSRQLRALGRTATVILEPTPRDSAPAMAAAAAYIHGIDPDGIAVVLAADHHVPDAAAFAQACSLAALGAARGRIVTLGVAPTEPSPAYGYIAPGQAFGDQGLFEVQRFVEKPDVATAERYIAEGFLWNSGNFIVSARTLLDELDRHAPDVSGPVRLAMSRPGYDGVIHLKDAFRDARKISIDHAVMEKSDRVTVLPVDFEWSDLGAWDAVWAHSPQDGDGNAIMGQAVLVNARNTLVQNRDGQTSVLIGVSDVAVITEAGQVLVCALDSAQSVKIAYDRLKAMGVGGIDLPPLPPPPLRHWLDASALPLWWSLGADHERGGFQESLDAAARPSDGPRRVRVQARQAFVYGQAGAKGWAGPWRQAAQHGIDYLMRYYRRPDGLFRGSVGLDGQPVDDDAKLYDQAFVLLALAVAPQREQAEAEAVALRAAIGRELKHPAGGYRETGEEAFLANPLMHLFEAALAWEEAGGDDGWAVIADELADLALGHFIDESGHLYEVFDAHWRPVTGSGMRCVEPGHQFEWAWLLERWARKRSSPRAHAAALRLFKAGAAGIDIGSGLAIDGLDDGLRPVDASSRLWPQTEWLKASIILGETDEAARAAQAIWRYLDTPIPGLWRDRHDQDEGFLPGPAPASSLYHLFVAIHELPS